MKLKDSELRALLQFERLQPSNKEGMFSEEMNISDEWIPYDDLVPLLKEDVDRRFTKQGKRRKRVVRKRATVEKEKSKASPKTLMAEVTCGNCLKRQTLPSGTVSTCSCGTRLTILKRIVPRKRKNIKVVASGSKRVKAVDVDLTVK